MKDLASGNRTVRHTTQAEEHSVGSQKFSATTSSVPNTWQPNTLDCYPLNYYNWNAFKWKTNTKDELLEYNSRNYLFNQGDHRKSLKGVPTSSGGHGRN